MLKGKNIDDNSTDQSSKPNYPNVNINSELKKTRTKILDSGMGRNKSNPNRTALVPNFFDAKRSRIKTHTKSFHRNLY